MQSSGEMTGFRGLATATLLLNAALAYALGLQRDGYPKC